jgi:glyoxylase-like metal-dependent hydrolase (beta-lactamase superfamily II)
MKEIIPGLYQLTLTLQGFSPNSINTYLLRDCDGYTIVDTGWDLPASVTSLEAQLAESGIRFSDIKRMLLTHCHSDHLGMMARFQKSYHTLACLHRNEKDLMKVRYNSENNYWPQTDQFLQTHGMPQSELTSDKFQMPGVGSLPPPDVWLQGGEELAVGNFTLRVINTPGHTPGHVSFYEPQFRLLMSGDVLLPTIATNAATHVQHMTNPLQQYLSSLSTLKEMDIELVLPGHEYIFSNHRKRIEELFEHHRQRSAEVLRAFASDSRTKTAYDVACLISWMPKSKPIAWAQLGAWDKRFAMMQTIAHLEELAFSGKLTRMPCGGKVFYQ